MVHLHILHGTLLQEWDFTLLDDHLVFDDIREYVRQILMEPNLCLPLVAGSRAHGSLIHAVLGGAGARVRASSAAPLRPVSDEMSKVSML